MAKTRIVIADDYAVFRRGLRSILEAQPGLEVCGEADNGREAVELVRRLKADLAILDLGMPGLNGLEATRQIIKKSPQAEVLILTVHSSEAVLRDVLRVGARGFLLKSDPDTSLIAAVDALRHHKPYLGPHATELLVERYLENGGAHAGATAGRLTPREREVVQLVCEGKSNKDTAILLGITPRTVEAHRANVMRKLNLNSVSDLVRYAIRNNITES